MPWPATARRPRGRRLGLELHVFSRILFGSAAVGRGAANETTHMHPTLNIAVKAARRAASIINRASTQLDLLAVQAKSPNDFVTEVDRAAEAAIIEVLRETYPQHGILAEESGESGDSEFQWIIDPLDGTTNFIHGFPQYAISIALAKNGVLEQAVIYDPTRNELFTATKGAGAFLNDRRIRVSKRTRLGESLIGTGFPFRQFEHIDAYLGAFRELSQKTAGIRRPGAAALDLAYVACGRLDGFWEMGLQPWDMAAGALLIQEAGGLVSDFAGEGQYLATGNVVAGTPKVFAQLLPVIQAHRGPALSA
jgi:myo-inositol-1(or 4)-monophosphatase